MFTPSRLAIARKRRQMTKKSLAEEARVCQVTLTRIEKGTTKEPEIETISALAKALNYPVGFFFEEECDIPTAEQVSFRSLSTLTSRQRDAALTAGGLGWLLSDWISERFNLPAVELLDLRDEDPVSAAMALRRHWSIGSRPISQLVKLMESKGIRVFSLSENNKNIDAFSVWRHGVPYVFLNTYKSAERSRFDAAHEIGHLVLHRHGVQKGREAESEADQFSSSLLIPRDDFVSIAPRISSLDQLVSIKKRWGVSVASLARAARDSGVLSEWYYREFCKQLSVRGYRSSEPNPMPREESVLLKKVLSELWKERLTRESIATDLCLPLDEISSLVDGLISSVNSESIQTTRPKLRAI